MARAVFSPVAVLPALLLSAVACAPSVPRVVVMDAPDAAAARAPDGGAADARDGTRAPPSDGRSAAGDGAPPDETGSDGGGQAEATLSEDAAGDGKSAAAHVGGTDAAADGDAAQDGPGFTYDGALPVEPRAGEVVIDELLVNPAGTDTNREWIEIANITALPFDLRGLHVADSAKDVAVDAGLLAPGAILVLGQSTDPAKNGGAPVALAYGGTISLNNDGDSIAICLGPCASGRVLDRVVWDKDLGDAYDGHAAIVDVRSAAPGSAAFCPAMDPFGSAASFGTPGAANPVCPEIDASALD